MKNIKKYFLKLSFLLKTKYVKQIIIIIFNTPNPIKQISVPTKRIEYLLRKIDTTSSATINIKVPIKQQLITETKALKIPTIIFDKVVKNAKVVCLSLIIILGSLL